MIPPGIYRRRKGKQDTCEFVKARNGGPAMRLCSIWWDAEGELTQEGVDEILMGLASQVRTEHPIATASDYSVSSNPNLPLVPCINYRR